MLRLTNRWVWDFWLADAGNEFHLFYLQAPRSLGDQAQRHFEASVGHAVSTDLRDWTVLGDALLPGPPGAWDDLATWTGSIVKHEDQWYLFYTGTTRDGAGVGQAIGLATSPDLVTWSRYPRNPVIEVDERWYELVDADAWRDPWVFRDPQGDGWHALITARGVHGPADARGVIGHAWSPDLVEWEVREPLSGPGEFGHLEVPQVETLGATPVLLFSVAADRFSRARRARLSKESSSTFLAVGASMLGPWDLERARRLDVPDLYSARIIRDRAGAWQVMGFYDGSDRGEFVGEISDPIPLADLGLP